MPRRPYPELTPGARAAMQGTTRVRPGMSGYHEQEVREIVETILRTSFCRTLVGDPANVDVGLHAIPEGGFMLTFLPADLADVEVKPPPRPVLQPPAGDVMKRRKR